MHMSASLGLVEHAVNLLGEDRVCLDAAEEEPDDGAHVAVARQSELTDEAMLRFGRLIVKRWTGEEGRSLVAVSA